MVQSPMTVQNAPSARWTFRYAQGACCQKLTKLHAPMLLGAALIVLRFLVPPHIPSMPRRTPMTPGTPSRGSLFSALSATRRCTTASRAATRGT